jgi:hypothetical protein
VRLKTAVYLIFTASMTAAACSDSVTLQPAPVAAPAGLRLYAGVDSSGEVWPARIRSATATLEPISPTGYTDLKAEMYFDGTEASISGSSMIRESSGQIVTRTHPVWEAEEGGLNAHHWAQYNLIVQSKCGAIVESDVTFRASFEIINLEGSIYPFDSRTTGRSPSTRQADCPPCPAGATRTGSEADGGSDSCTEEKDEEQGPAGGGGGDCPECVEEPIHMICRVRYWYWTDTNEVYDWTILWCA